MTLPFRPLLLPVILLAACSILRPPTSRLRQAVRHRARRVNRRRPALPDPTCRAPTVRRPGGPSCHLHRPREPVNTRSVRLQALVWAQAQAQRFRGRLRNGRFSFHRTRAAYRAKQSAALARTEQTPPSPRTTMRRQKTLARKALSKAGGGRENPGSGLARNRRCAQGAWPKSGSA